ncbi:outer membrane beta-barrel protein [Methylobacterium sp. Leaf118]|uniref:outer membrane beta-barrel protein n=1 Tax=Methylobacterium sp. Leaf118 TaxID=2876562 RepID=UPI001E363F4B|nr:outer membrane beta-barrel protein [Methylobacterium sp. Leaf118]
MTAKLHLKASVAAVSLLVAGPALAADMPMKSAPPIIAVEHCKAAISSPTFGGLIKANPNPACFTTGIGDIYVGGAVTGFAYTQTNAFGIVAPGGELDRYGRVDFTNLQAWIQKADGPLQFYVHTGLYSIPALGLPLYSSFEQTESLFGPVPVAVGKWQINDEWSIQAGRMFTNIGSELLFSYQNLNISRGLVFNQENFINQGVQVNYASGPLAASISVNDGFYSGQLNWVTGLITYKLDDSNTIGINGGTHFSDFDSSTRSPRFQFATINSLQNSSIVSLNYTYANGPWIISPYVQYTNVASKPNYFTPLVGAETWGGALLAGYAFNENFGLAGRVEYIAQSGTRGDFAGVTATNVLFGPGSSAFSFTITPTYTWERYFIRGEFATVQAYDVAKDFGLGVGAGFGRNGLKSSQERYLIETGFTF